MDYKQTKKEIKKLLKTKEYEKALQLTIALRQAYPRETSLHKLINKTKTLLRNQELGGRADYLKKGLKTIRTLRRNDDFEGAIKAGAELLEVDPENKAAKKLLHKSKIDFIEQKLHDPIRKEWSQKQEYEQLYLFYQKLKKVFPHYIRLNKLIDETEKKMIIADRVEKKAFAADSLKKLQQMLAEGKYEEVIEGAEELMAFTHEGSKEGKAILQVANKANRREIEADTFKYMKNQKPLLEAAYKSGGEGIIKL